MRKAYWINLIGYHKCLDGHMVSSRSVGQDKLVPDGRFMQTVVIMLDTGTSQVYYIRCDSNLLILVVGTCRSTQARFPFCAGVRQIQTLYISL